MLVELFAFLAEKKRDVVRKGESYKTNIGIRFILSFFGRYIDVFLNDFYNHLSSMRTIFRLFETFTNDVIFKFYLLKV